MITSTVASYGRSSPRRMALGGEDPRTDQASIALLAARTATAARRQLAEMPLDARDRRALTRVVSWLAQEAEALRRDDAATSGGDDASFAFATMTMRAAQPSGGAAPTGPEHLADMLERIAAQVRAVLDEEGTEMAVTPRERAEDAENVAQMFDELNRLVLSELGLPGDLVEGTEPAR